MTTTIAIGGMTCASCAARIERTLNKLEGVKSASVNLASEKLTIEYDGIDFSAIKKRIETIGYQALEKRKNEEETVAALQKKLIAAVIFAAPLLYLAMAPMIGLKGIDDPLSNALTQAFLAAIVVAIGYRFFVVGFKALFALAPNMDSLIAIGVSAAFSYSLFNAISVALGEARAAHNLYFESAGAIIALILLGKTLEARSKSKAGEALKALLDLAPKNALLLDNGKWVEKSVDDVAIGDTLMVKPGGRIPIDGVTIGGQSYVDESMLTGESRPIAKRIGDPLYAGTMNENGALTFKATKAKGETALMQIARMVEEAQGSKAPIARLADRVSGVFVPVVCAVALFACAAQYLLTFDAAFALKVFVSVLVIACPCALGLATPTAIMVATGIASKRGILIKSGEALERLGKVTTIFFDKTGTLTEGKFAVSYEGDAAFLPYFAAAEAKSEHPIGKAIAALCETPFEAEAFEAIAGRGVKALVNGKNVEIGTDGGEIRAKIDGAPIARFMLDDRLKSDAKATIAALKTRGIETIMLTGDRANIAEAIAKEVGIDRFKAGVLPQEKAAEIRAAQAEGKIVAFAGDGINDAIALAQADAGVAIGAGTDIAIKSAGIVLIKNELIGVTEAIAIARAAISNIKQNLFWAFCYNALGVPLACFGVLNPMIAAAAMSLSSVSVLANALRLRRIKL
jgi:Cu+-exporting ATPase